MKPLPENLEQTLPYKQLHNRHNLLTQLLDRLLRLNTTVGYVSVGSTVAGIGTGLTGTGPGSPATLASVFIYATFYAPSVTVA